MKNYLMMITSVMVLFMLIPTKTEAEEVSEVSEVSEVQTGDTLTLLGKKYGLDMNDAPITNENTQDLRFVGTEVTLDGDQETIITTAVAVAAVQDKNIPEIDVDAAEDTTITNEEKDLLARLVHAEAEGEPFAGKVAVANVVLNRVEHEQFPDSVEEVIFEENAFQPVQNDSIYEPADKEAHEAVEEAVDNGELDKEVVYFYNPETATSNWIFTREVVKKIGNHAFAI
ncbi:cell wall hydrolase [Metabacillus herbersteinensis]|uniref:Cell wall hydrolase n=1 Tax=Metabacillus herbersteinensis TaxID=283816 RepID=A0ABV6GGZ8_9BACI